MVQPRITLYKVGESTIMKRLSNVDGLSGLDCAYEKSDYMGVKFLDLSLAMIYIFKGV